MKCPRCKGNTKVTNHSKKSQINSTAPERYRVCIECGLKFKTREVIIHNYNFKRREKDAEDKKER